MGKHFPSLNWLLSYSKYIRVLEPFFNKVQNDYGSLRNTANKILQTEDSLNEIVQLVGKESLSEDQKVVMDVAKIIREDFLQQNAFTDYDYMCPLNKSVGMLRCIITLYNCSQKAIGDSPEGAKCRGTRSRQPLAALLMNQTASFSVSLKASSRCPRTKTSMNTTTNYVTRSSPGFTISLTDFEKSSNSKSIQVNMLM